jgi:acetyl esterase/lipase
MVRPRALLVVALLALLTSCGGGVQGGTSSRDGGGDGAGAQDVATQVVPAPHVPALRVVAPRTGGPWPVVLALHGVGGSGQDMLELASRVAESGAVVFVPTYSTDVSTQAGMQQTGDDLACAYRAA